jgi:ribosome maturation factor RimP
MEKMDLQQQIEHLVNEQLTGSDCFLVDVRIAGTKTSQKKVVVWLDGDKGVSIDTCAEVSRRLGNKIEEQELIDTAYTLEVSSPGIDQPLRLPRQYPQHLGRKVRVVLSDGSTHLGTLTQVTEKSILIAEAAKGKKKAAAASAIEIPIDTIEKTFVLVSFN